MFAHGGGGIVVDLRAVLRGRDGVSGGADDSESGEDVTVVSASEFSSSSHNSSQEESPDLL